MALLKTKVIPSRWKPSKCESEIFRAVNLLQTGLKQTSPHWMKVKIKAASNHTVASWKRNWKLVAWLKPPPCMLLCTRNCYWGELIFRLMYVTCDWILYVYMCACMMYACDIWQTHVVWLFGGIDREYLYKMWHDSERCLVKIVSCELCTCSTGKPFWYDYWDLSSKCKTITYLNLDLITSYRMVVMCFLCHAVLQGFCERLQCSTPVFISIYHCRNDI